MQIRRVQIKNYRNLKSVDVTLIAWSAQSDQRQQYPFRQEVSPT